jgi:nucleoside-triphosphatase
VLDELGKMEFLSPAFVILLERVFQSPNPVLGTILYRRHPLGDRLRRTPGVELIQVTTQNRDALPADLARRFSITG